MSTATSMELWIAEGGRGIWAAVSWVTVVFLVLDLAFLVALEVLDLVVLDLLACFLVTATAGLAVFCFATVLGGGAAAASILMAPGVADAVQAQALSVNAQAIPSGALVYTAVWDTISPSGFSNDICPLVLLSAILVCFILNAIYAPGVSIVSVAKVYFLGVVAIDWIV